LAPGWLALGFVLGRTGFGRGAATAARLGFGTAPLAPERGRLVPPAAVPRFAPLGARPASRRVDVTREPPLALPLDAPAAAATERRRDVEAVRNVWFNSSNRFANSARLFGSASDIH
jgi:hypothetical protein